MCVCAQMFVFLWSAVKDTWKDDNCTELTILTGGENIKNDNKKYQEQGNKK